MLEPFAFALAYRAVESVFKTSVVFNVAMRAGFTLELLRTFHTELLRTFHTGASPLSP